MDRMGLIVELDAITYVRADAGKFIIATEPGRMYGPNNQIKLSFEMMGKLIDYVEKYHKARSDKLPKTDSRLTICCGKCGRESFIQMSAPIP